MYLFRLWKQTSVSSINVDDGDVYQSWSDVARAELFGMHIVLMGNAQACHCADYYRCVADIGGFAIFV